MGRPESRLKNLSRAIDLDLLYCGEEAVATDRLTLPHPGLTQRAFVLRPLADIRPDLSQGQLLVAIHRGSRPSVDRTLEALFAKLNEMEIIFPGTELILHYQLVGSNPDENSQKCVASTSQR
jgi:7,8-dihydro-6-hydroxymethylpterin-pyrophosphokinase